jgi:hypothetical protein
MAAISATANKYLSKHMERRPMKNKIKISAFLNDARHTYESEAHEQHETQTI